MTHCHCGIRLSVADTAGVCVHCTDDPLPTAPVIVLAPYKTPAHWRPRDEQGRTLCRCGAVAMVRHSYCAACHREKIKAYRLRVREGVTP